MTVLGAIALLTHLLTPPAGAQGLMTATVSGTVTDAGGRPVAGALVTLASIDRGRTSDRSTDGGGGFAFPLVAPGSYEVRVEALGYRPVVARTLSIAAGESSSVALRLIASPPPVLTVDTLRLDATVASSHWSAGGLRLRGAELTDSPHRFEDLSSVASLASSFDGSFGSQGLPGSMALMIADGLPVYRAPHPLARAEQLSDAIFPRSSVAGATAYPHSPNVEWAGSAGGYLPLATRTGTGAQGLEIEGAWSGGPLWSSNELNVSSPTLTSFHGAAAATLPVSPGVSQMVVSGDAFQQETPLAPRISESIGASLSGVDPDLIASLSSPSTERLSRFSGLARFDAEQGLASRLVVRGAVGYAKREFDGPGPVSPARDVALPEETVEYSVAAAYVTERRPGLVLELRAGLSGSRREFDHSDGMTAAFLTGSGVPLGRLAGGSGESSRMDALILPVVRYDGFGGTLEVGGSARVSSHDGSHAVEERLYSDGPALVAGRGFARAVASQEASYSTRELGAFAQYDVDPRPGVRLRLGGRFDYELLPESEATLNSAWQQASGLRNDVFPTRFRQAGAQASITWDPSLDGSTTVYSAVTVDHGDIDTRVLGELYAHDDQATSTRYAGTGLTWPGGAMPPAATTLPTLTLLGPDARAPRSAHASVGFVRLVTRGWYVHVEGAYRRTDFLMRRRNLNLPVLPQANDAYGRDVFGTLQQDGSLVMANGADARRIAGFHEVWALDPDGWSDYRGVTAGLEYAGPMLGLYASYTKSETTDNWVGASRASAEAELAPLLPAGQAWSEGTSDFDVADRVAASATIRMAPVTASVVYRFRSGLPFTPGYRAGVDANGDGSLVNDVAYVDGALVDPLLAAWPCLSDQMGGFAARNSCRGHSAHSLDVRLRVGLGSIAGRGASLVFDAFNLIESKDGVLDEALLLVDPTGSITTSPDGSTVTVPVNVNPDFGRVLHPSSRGRMLRIGFRIG